MYSILYVDDEPGLLEIAKLFLELDKEFSVDTDTSAVHALGPIGSRSYDAIIADYQMPGMDGIAFLKAVRHQYGDIPFILFTGRGREEVVIEAINNGADFYIQKGGDPRAQFAELAHKVKQAVARKRAEHSLVESEKRLTDIINFLPDATFAIDKRGTVIAWNRAIEDMTGVSAAEMLGKGDFEYALPFYGTRRKILIDLVFEPDEVIAENYTNIRREKDVLIADTTLPHPKGKAATLMGKASPLYNRQGEIVGAIESIRDVTQRERDAERLARQGKTLAVINEVIRTASLQQTIEEPIRVVLTSALDILHYDAGGVYLVDDDRRTARVVCSENLDPAFIREVDNVDIYAPPFRTLFVEGKPIVLNNLETIFPHAAGISGLRSIASIPVISHGIVIGALNVASRGQSVISDEDRDVLLTIAQELGNAITRMKAELALRESEEKYRTLVDLSPLAVLVHRDGKIVYANPECIRLVGAKGEEDLLGKEILPFIHPDDHPMAAGHFRLLAAGKTVPLTEERIFRLDGRVVSIEIAAKPMLYAGRPSVITVFRDITERKKAEDDLRSAYEKIAASEEELRNNLEEIVQAQQEREKSEKNFRALVDNAPDAIYIQTNNRFRYLNNAALRLLGASFAGDLLGTSTWDRIHPSFHERIRERVRNLTVDIQPVGLLDEVYLKLDGTPIDVEVSAVPFLYEGEHGALVMVRDITERKQQETELRAAYEQIAGAEEELRSQYTKLAENEQRIRESEARLRHMLGFYEKAGQSEDELRMYAVEGAGAVTGSPLGYLAFLNEDETVMTMFAWSESAMKECALREKPLVYPVEKTGLWGEAVRQRRPVITNDYAAPNPRKKGYPEGHPRIIRHMNIPVFDGGRIVLVAGVANRPSDYTETEVRELTLLMQGLRDVLKRHRAEEKLRSAHERNRRILEEAPLPLAFVNTAGKLTFVNDRFVHVFGYTAEDIPDLEAWWRKTYPDPAYRKQVMQQCEEAVRHSAEEHADIRPAEYTVTCKNGEERIIEISGIALPDGFLATFIDLTERRKADAALRESEERYRTILENIQGVVYRSDRDGNLIMASPGLLALLGYSSLEECLGMNIAEKFWMYPDRRQKVLELLKKTGEVSNHEVLLKTKDGRAVTVAMSSHFYYDKDGAVAGVEGIFYDITEQKRIQEALEKRLVALTQPLEDGEVAFEDLFNIDEIQHLQDEFAKATGIGMLLTRPDGTPITKPSNFCRLCSEIVRRTPAGRERCYQSDAVLGGFHEGDGPYIHTCLSAGLWGAGANIVVGDRHIANWLIGQVRNEAQTEEGMRKYAREIGVNEEDFIAAFREVPVMSSERFASVAQALSLMANQLSRSAYQNVQQARFITERKRAEEALRRSEERLKLAVDASSDGLFDWDMESNVAYFSPQYFGMLGYAPGDLPSGFPTWVDLLHPDDRERSLAIVDEYYTGARDSHAMEFRLRAKDGSWRWILAKGKIAGRNAEGKPVRMVGTHSDITEQKRIEDELRESKERYRSLVESSFDGIAINQDGIIVFANTTAARILGANDPSDLIGKPALGFVHPDYRSLIADRIRQADTSPQTLMHEKFLRVDGTPVDVDVATRPSLWKGRPAAYMTFRDITDEVAASAVIQRLSRQDQEALHVARMGHFEFDMASQAFIFNDQFYDMIGTTVDEAGGYVIPAEEFARKFVHPDSAGLVAENVRKAMETTDPDFQMQFESKNFRGDGSVMWVMVWFRIQKDAAGNTIGFYGVNQDITERKLAEEALRRSEATARTLTQNPLIATILVDPDGVCLDANETMAHRFSRRAVDFIGRPIWDLMPPDQVEIRRQLIGQVLRTKQPIRLTEERDGVWLENFLNPIFDDRGNVVSIVAMSLDITEQKKTEHALRESEERYRSLVESSFDGIAIHQDGIIVFVNRTAAKLLGAGDPSHFIGKPALSIVHPDYHRIVAERIRQAPQRSLDLLHERFLKVDRSAIDVDVATTPCTWQGQPAVYVTFRDITAQKKAEEALRQKTEELDRYFSASLDLFCIADTAGYFRRLNPEWERTLGYSLAELEGRRFLDFVHPDDLPATLAAVADLADQKGVLNFTNRYRHKDGSYRWIEWRSFPSGDRIFAAARDITKRKRMEEELRESRAELASILHGSPVLQFVIDREHRIAAWNKALEEYTGLTAADVVGTDQQWRAFYPHQRPVLADLLVDNNIDGLFKWYSGKLKPSRYVEGAYEATDFFPAMGASGTWLSFTAAPIRNADGEIIGAVETLEDITENRLAEEALRESEEKHKQIFESFVDVYYQTAKDGEITVISPSIFPLTGWRPEELIGKHASVLYADPADRHRLFERLVRERAVDGFEGLLKKRDGTTVPVSVNARLRLTVSGELDGTIGTVRDMTNEVAARLALQESEKKYRRILENMQDVYFRADKNGIITMVSPSAVRLYGYGSAEEMIGIPAVSLYAHHEDRESMLRKLRESGRIADFTGEGRRKDGTLFWASLNAQFIRDDEGQIQGTEGIVRDISERKSMDHAIREANRKLALLSSITRHDVANKVAIITGFAQAARMQKLDPRISDILVKIESAGSDISRQIAFTKTYQELGLNMPAWYSVSELVSRQKAEGVAISCTCPAEVYADPMLEKVFSNLVDNAVRHGEHVTEIDVSCEPGPEGLVITVADNGVGVPADLKEIIFDREFGKHTGFGLFLAREILAITGITIREAGTPGKGARFEIVVPKGEYREVPAK